MQFADFVPKLFLLEIGKGGKRKREGNEVGNVRNPESSFRLSRDIQYLYSVLDSFKSDST